MLLPGEGGPQRQRAAAPGMVHPWTHQHVPQAAPLIWTLEGPPPAPTCCSSPQGQILPLVQPSQPSHEAGSAPGKLTGRERQIRMHRSSRAINTHLYPSLNPSHSAMSAVRKIISSSLLQHKHLNSTSIYLWSPHDTSRSAREEEMYLRRKIKMCVCTSETRGLPRE